MNSPSSEPCNQNGMEKESITQDPKALKQKLEDTIGYYLHTFTRDGGWEKFEAVHKDDIPDLIEDILKLIQFQNTQSK